MKKINFTIKFLVVILLIGVYALNNSANALMITEFLAANCSYNLDPDYNCFSDWIEIYNSGTQSVSLDGYYLTDDLADTNKWQFPSGVIIASNSFMLIWADKMDAKLLALHTNFKLSGDGEEIGLYNPGGELIDSIIFPQQEPDISFGRQADTFSNLVYFSQPTPSAPNTSPGIADNIRAPVPEFSMSGGIYSQSHIIELTATTNSIIRYTLDGSIPELSSTIYSAPIIVSNTTIIRARVYKEDILPGKTITHTYFINITNSLPIISLVTSPSNLYDYNIGIYVDSNISQRVNWERPVNIEFYNTNSIIEFNVEAGITLFGRTAIYYPEKSFAVFFRDKYGNDFLDFKLFSNKNLDEFGAFLLRSSSDDWPFTMFRDGMIQSLVDGICSLDFQAYRPAVVYLNGEYFGIHNIREKYNEDYLAYNNGIDPDKVDILKMFMYLPNNTISIQAGSSDHFIDMLKYIETNNISSIETYEHVKTLMDVDNYIEYIIAEIFCANTSWRNNRKLWRKQSPTGKWRWLINDLDRGFISPNNTTLSDTISDDQLFNSLLKNKEFKEEFIQKFMSFLNIIFIPQQITKTINIFKASIEQEMPRHIVRWSAYGGIPSMSKWHSRTQIALDFANARWPNVTNNLQNQFGLDDTADLKIVLDAASQGEIFIHDLLITNQNFNGAFYKNIPIRIKATANPGSRFVRWSGITNSSSDEISIILNQDSSITAEFSSIAPIVINEMHYNPSDSQGLDDNFEFLELYNSGTNLIALSGFFFSNGIEFTFPDASFISPDEYIVITINSNTYSDNGFQVFQWKTGKLSNSGEEISLFDTENNQVDFVSYDDGISWPPLPDGAGPSLELLAPYLNNSLPGNWLASEIFGGTPGAANSVPEPFFIFVFIYFLAYKFLNCHE